MRAPAQGPAAIREAEAAAQEVAEAAIPDPAAARAAVAAITPDREVGTGGKAPGPTKDGGNPVVGTGKARPGTGAGASVCRMSVTTAGRSDIPMAGANKSRRGGIGCAIRAGESS